MNSWPDGYRHAISQTEHERWNSSHYPGTRQVCEECSEPTGRCEDDSIYHDDKGPLCEQCANTMEEREKLARRADENYRERIYAEIAEDLWAVLDRRNFDTVRHAVDAIAAGEIRHLSIHL